MIYAALSTLLGVGFLALAIRVYRVREGDAARKAAGQLFAFSIHYLFTLYATLLVEHLLGLPLLPAQI